MGAIRLMEPIELPTSVMLWVAAGGIVTEVIAFWLMYQRQKSNLNITAFPELLHAGRMLGGAMRLSGLTMSSPEVRFLRGMLYGWQDRGDRTARTQVALARQMADLSVLVRGMLLLASEDFLRLVECGPAGLAAGTAHVRALLRRELAAPARTRLREKLHAELGLEPDSDDDESDIDARLSEDLDGNLWDRWYGDVPGCNACRSSRSSAAPSLPSVVAKRHLSDHFAHPSTWNAGRRSPAVLRPPIRPGTAGEDRDARRPAGWWRRNVRGAR